MSLAWLDTARAFFTTLGPNVPWDRSSIDRRVSEAREDGCDTLMAFVQDEGYALWPSQVAPRAPRAGEQDLVGMWVEASHAAGVRFVAQWMGVHVQTIQMTRHPAWLQRDAQGVPAAAMCLNGPFGDSLAAQIDEVVRAYPVDGVYFDGLYARMGGCFCDACAGRFEALTGRVLQRTAGRGRAEDRAGEHWLDFGAGAQAAEDDDLARFRFATVEHYLARVAALVRRIRPGTAIILDTLGISGAYWANAQDPAALRPSVDAFALECYPDQLREPLWHAAFEADLLAAEGQRPIWMLRWIARDPDGDLVAVPAGTLESHVATSVLHGARPTIVEMNLYSVDGSLRPAVRSTLEAAARADAWRTGTTPVEWAAILSSRSMRWAASARGAGRQALDPVAGAWQALTEAHLPVRGVTDEAVDEGNLPEGTRVLVLPDAAGLTARQAESLARLVEGGLGLVATYRAGLAETSRLVELLGVRSVGLGHRAGRIGTESLGGGELVNYLSFRDGSPITAPLAGRPSSWSGGFVRLVEAEGEILGWIHDADLRAMDGERWFAWYPGAPTWPAGVARQVGRGRVVYWAMPIDSLFFREGRPEFGELLARSCRWAAAADPEVEVKAPVTVASRVWRGPAATVVALANRTTNDLYAIGAGVAIGAASSSAGGAGSGGSTMRSQYARAIIPVGDISVTLPWRRRRPPAVEAVTGRSVRVDVEGGRATAWVDALGALEVLRIT
jgi:hypothetical protein